MERPFQSHLFPFCEIGGPERWIWRVTATINFDTCDNCREQAIASRTIITIGADFHPEFQQIASVAYAARPFILAICTMVGGMRTRTTLPDFPSSASTNTKFSPMLIGSDTK